MQLITAAAFVLLQDVDIAVELVRRGQARSECASVSDDKAPYVKSSAPCDEVA